MKKLIFALAVALLSTSFASQSHAAVKEDTTKTINIINPSQVKPNHYTLVYSSESRGKVSVDIYDQKGKHLTNDIVVNFDGFRRSYDFSSLPKGNYIIRVKDQNQVYRTTVNHLQQADKKLAVNVSALDMGSKYNLQVMHNSTKPVYVHIYNIDNQIIFSDVIDVDHNFSRVYDLNNIHHKVKSILVYSDGRTVKHYLN